MRIEQPKHLRPLHIESFRRNTMVGVRGLIVVIILGIIPSALMLGSLALRAANGMFVSPWRWLGGAGTGPLLVVLTKVAAPRLLAGGDRFVEFQGDWIRLGPAGQTFRASDLVSCKIEPDDNFPQVYRFCFFFRSSGLARPSVLWSMMVENRKEAEEFRRAIEEFAAEQRNRPATRSGNGEP